MTKILITGGAGFIGSNFVKYMIDKYPDYEFTNLDALTYCGNLENLKDIEDKDNYAFVKGDIRDKEVVNKLFKDSDYVINFAAESHVDRSISDPEIFIKSNVLGTQVLLNAAKEYGVEKYVQISTDEVYGTLGETGYFTETTPLATLQKFLSGSPGTTILICFEALSSSLLTDILRESVAVVLSPSSPTSRQKHLKRKSPSSGFTDSAWLHAAT